jgi:Fe-S-cluster containining protein
MGTYCDEPLDCTGCGAACCYLYGERCPYVAKDGTCLIYEDRPEVCRGFDCRFRPTKGAKYEMGCGCAQRMRELVLPEAGYVLVDGVWIDHEDGDAIPDGEIENHHTRLTLKRNKLRRAALRVAARKGQAKAAKLLDKLTP